MSLHISAVDNIIMLATHTDYGLVGVLDFMPMWNQDAESWEPHAVALTPDGILINVHIETLIPRADDALLLDRMAYGS